jgi:RluA family pseudouridine synthase
MKKNYPYTIIYDDENIIALNKASGIAVSADRWEESKERLDKIVQEDLNIGTILRVHRIDKGTSGLVIFAKNHAAHKKLSADFEKRAIKKTYIAIVHGRITWDRIACDLALVPDGNKRHLTIVDKYHGKESLTKFEYIAGAGNFSIVNAYPETGRQHQIRVHLSNMGHPVVCDEFYGTANPVYLSHFKRAWRGDKFDERPLIARLGLHSEILCVPDYFADEQQDGTKNLVLHAPLHNDMAAAITQIKKCGG